MATGALTFTAGGALFNRLQGLSMAGEVITRNPILSNMAVGFSFGATSGLTDEGISQYQKGIFDPLRLAGRTLLQGGADALGAAGGYGVGRLYSTPQVHPVFKDTDGPTLATTL